MFARRSPIRSIFFSLYYSIRLTIITWKCEATYYSFEMITRERCSLFCSLVVRQTVPR